jgi:hypothetical protein
LGNGEEIPGSRPFPVPDLAAELDSHLGRISRSQFSRREIRCREH